MLAITLVLAPPAAASVAPDPGGDETADVPLPPPGKYLGLNGNPVGGFHGLTEEDNLELIRAIGGNTVRASLDWRTVEPKKGEWHQYSWNRFGRLYDGALARGMRPLFIIGYAPPWARYPKYRKCTNYYACEFPPAPSYDGDWARYAAEVARRFPKAIIEVWNEPNLTYFWESGPDPQRFAKLQVIAYDAIKAVSPSTIVLAGGLSNNPQTKDGHISLREFLERAYAASPSIKGHMDAISFHPYPWTLELGAGSLFATSFDTVRSVRDANGDPQAKLFASEVGVNTYLVSEQQQADWALRAYRRTMTMDDVLGVVFQSTIEPGGNGIEPSFNWGYAWTRYGENPPEPKPVFCAFVAAAGRSYSRC